MIKSVSPTSGSEEGGTKITLTSDNIAADQSLIDIDVGGQDCKLVSFSSSEMVCKTPEAPQDMTSYPGSRYEVEGCNSVAMATTRENLTPLSR